jgi:hypothetical protein
MWHLKKVIWMECRGLLIDKVILLHDNTYRNSVGVITRLLKILLGMSCPSTMQPRPCDYIIRTMKKCSAGKRCQHYAVVSAKICQWVQTLSPDQFFAGIKQVAHY